MRLCVFGNRVFAYQREKCLGMTEINKDNLDLDSLIIFHDEMIDEAMKYEREESRKYETKRGTSKA